MSSLVLILGGYAVALAIGAFVLELGSAHTSKRSQQYRTAGFDYDDEHDKWVCPEGEDLWPHEYDHARRLMRYRAKAHICNGCPVKNGCTDADRGREIVKPVDPWPHSEAGRFHRIISIAMMVIAMMLLVVAMVKSDAAIDLLVVLPLLAAFVGITWWYARDLRAHPANAPGVTSAAGLRVAVADSTGSAPRSKWASVNRSAVENTWKD